MSFLINVVLAVATLWNAAEDHSKYLSDFRAAVGIEKAKAFRKLFLLWLFPVLSIALIPLTWSDQTKSELAIAELNRDAAALRLELEKLKRNDPVNLPIFTMSADVELKLQNMNGPRLPMIEFRGLIEICGVFLASTSARASFGPGAWGRYSATFTPRSSYDRERLRKVYPTALDLGMGCDKLTLTIGELSATNATIVSAWAVITVNGKPIRSFDLFPAENDGAQQWLLHSSNSVPLIQATTNEVNFQK